MTLDLDGGNGTGLLIIELGGKNRQTSVWDRKSGSMATLFPVEVQLSVRRGALAQIEVDKALIRNADLF